MEKDPRFAKIKSPLPVERQRVGQNSNYRRSFDGTKGSPWSLCREGLTIPQSILPYKSGVWVAHGSELLFLDDRNGDGRADEMSLVLSGFGFFRHPHDGPFSRRGRGAGSISATDSAQLRPIA